MRRAPILLLAGLVTAVVIGWGCLLAVDALAIEHHERSQTFAAVPTVRLATHGGGAVRVVGDGGDRIRVDFRWREGLKPPRVRARLVGDRLVVDTRCAELLNAFCRVDATVHVPRGTAIDGGGDTRIEVVDVGGPVALTVEDGAVRVTGAEGPVRVEGDNGSIRVADSTGPLVLRTDNGSIRTEGVRAETVEAESANGRIELDLADPPTTVSARTDNGSITVLVPDDGEPYATSLASDNGGTDDPILTAPTADRRITARSDNGSVSVRYRPAG